MIINQAAMMNYQEIEPPTEPVETDEASEDAEPDEVLWIALNLLEQNRPRQADELLTAALLRFAGDERLWLAAGISRMRRGSRQSAEAAFEMSAWLSDDADAQELYRLNRHAR